MGSTATYSVTTPITQQADVFPQPITALSFDPVSDALWTGTDSGSIVAAYTPRGMRGVTFPVGGGFAVKKIIAGENYVNALGGAGAGVGSWAKGGMNKWYFRPAASATAFSNVSSSAQTIAVSTVTPEMMLVNSFSGAEVRRISVPSTITHLHFSPLHLLSCSLDGYLRAHDPRTGMKKSEGGAELSVKAHASGIQGLQTSGNYVYTIGWTLRQGHPFPDPFVKIHDVRTMRPIAPVSFSEGPAFINVLPRLSSSIVVGSTQGLVNIINVADLSAPSEFYQLETASYITSAAVSPTGAYLAFGDADGIVHMLTNMDPDHSAPLNGFEGKPLEWADPPEPVPDIEFAHNTPLNSIGLPHYTTPLFSSWTATLVPRSLHFPPPAKIPQQVLNNLKMNAGLGYATLPKELRGRRNVVNTGAGKVQARFRSGKIQRSVSEPETPGEGVDIPKPFRKVEIEYSKFGVEDFDFAYYNKTDYSGLESHILNSYTNAVVQAMHYLQPVRRLAKSHITTNCTHEHCLLCELGFVSRMLEDARGVNCQSSNFCKTVGVLAQAHNQLELLDYGRDSPNTNYGRMIQTFNRFLVDRLVLEGGVHGRNPLLVPRTSARAAATPPASPVTQLLGVDGRNVVVCTACGAEREKETLTHVVDLGYPKVVSPEEPPLDFATVLGDSLVRQMTHKATCGACRRVATFETTRRVPARDLPPILAVNACVSSEETLKIWRDGRKHRFLRPEVRVRCGEDEEVEYELRAMAVEVASNDGRSHLCAIVKVPEAELREDLVGPWFVFNDFVVRNIPEGDALSFAEDWKVPTVLYLERVDMKDAIDYSKLPTTVDLSILSRDTNIAINRDKSAIKHELLRPDELPKPGTLVSIDAEFVKMQQEEIDYRTEGNEKEKVIRPARLGLARVSVVRGDGPKEGVPFIDDYIHTSEVIVDYLTMYSGIKFGDLDPMLSRYTLTPLKTVYKKLRLLIDAGCIFVGHGLSKDFRIINIFVPRDQVMDTVDIYFIRNRHRRLALKFLTWAVLQENIQQETHDSIEDACSALKVYKKFLEFEGQGTFDKKLDELYKTGKEYGWKPPDVLGNSTTSPSLAPATTSAPVATPVPFMMQGGLFQGVAQGGTFAMPFGAPAQSPFASAFSTSASAAQFANVFQPTPFHAQSMFGRTGSLSYPSSQSGTPVQSFFAPVPPPPHSHGHSRPGSNSTRPGSSDRNWRHRQ